MAKYTTIAVYTEIAYLIRDPNALALYVYLRSGIWRGHPRLRSFEAAVENFGWTFTQAYNAYDELKRIGVVQ